MNGVKLASAACAWLLAFNASPSTYAATAAQYISAGMPGVYGSVVGTVGWSFSSARNIQVTHLGIFDLDYIETLFDVSIGNGLYEEHPIGIWGDAGNLLASAVVPAGSGSLAIDGFRYVPIDPITLVAGETYVSGAYYATAASASGGDSILINGYSGAEFSFDPLLTPGSRRNDKDGIGTLDYPEPYFLAGQAIGPSFLFSPVPIPSAAWLFGYGLLGILGLAGRKNAV